MNLPHSSAVYGNVERSEVSASDVAHQFHASNTRMLQLTSSGVKKNDPEFIQGSHRVWRRSRREHFDMRPVILLQ